MPKDTTRFVFPEGATPLHDCSGLLLPWVQTLQDLNRAEAENIVQAANKYLRRSSRDVSSWFSYQELLSMHRVMFNRVWTWAGKTRKSVTSIGVPPGLIPMHLANLCQEVSSWHTEPIELTFVEKSARIHHRLVYIHPFENGNGRWARLVADRCLLSWKCAYPTWPDLVHSEGSIRQHYIHALRSADHGNYEPLVTLMKNFGAADPDIETFLSKKIYKTYAEGEKGAAKIRAFLRSNRTSQNTTHHH